MNYNLNSFVNRNEANNLREMIFNRARERDKSISEDIQADVMDVARESFVSKNNPFSQILAQAKDIETQEKIVNEHIPSEAKIQEEVGFPKRVLKARATEQERVVKDSLTTMMVHNNMSEARTGLSNKTSFMGALNFLNSQAAVSLLRKRADKFEVVI